MKPSGESLFVCLSVCLCLSLREFQSHEGKTLVYQGGKTQTVCYSSRPRQLYPHQSPPPPCSCPHVMRVYPLQGPTSSIPFTHPTNLHPTLVLMSSLIPPISTVTLPLPHVMPVYPLQGSCLLLFLCVFIKIVFLFSLSRTSSSSQLKKTLIRELANERGP